MGGEITRRRLLEQGAAAAATASVVGGMATNVAKAKLIGPAPGGRRKRVAVLGGGMAGLAAAHELIERGFEVHVYERKALGGKARSIPVANTAAGGRRALPGTGMLRALPPRALRS
jgi:heterodisulfide reductase subunit A-like polyferredoxin